jgi:hypothetical protein
VITVSRTEMPAQLFTVPGALHTLVGTVFSQGGQARARRNAWLAMCSNQVRAWERAEAQRALEPLTRPDTLRGSALG